MTEEEACPEGGTYSVRLTDVDFSGRPCLFLDRDGVLVEETNYLHRPEDVAVIPGVPQAIANVNQREIPVVVVTNQAGIGRGYYDWPEFLNVQRHILDVCRSSGAHCDMVLACAYHEEGVPPYDRAGHHWRKPAPGMLLEAARQLQIDLRRSYIIGDTLADLAAGAEAGLAGGALVLTGHGQREWASGGEAAFSTYRKGGFAARVAPDAAQAIEDWLAAL
jgi:D-glycero-D-manno-heptose 1,7-bisphosphate phosphatase